MSEQLIAGMISVVMPTFNSARYLDAAISSVLSQSYPTWELLIADDASTDNTYQLSLAWREKDARIRLLPSDENLGAGATRNRALNAAQGQYVAFLDADDYWMPEKLSHQLAFMERKDLSFSFTSYAICNEAGEATGQYADVRSSPRVGYRDMLAKRATIGCSTVMLNQSKLGRIQMPLLRTGQDYALWLSILKQGNYAERLPEVLTGYRIVPGSISRNKIKKAKRQWEIYRKVEGLRFPESIWYFLSYAYRAVVRS
jgi:teichuronic acid biosynthesis glycosyltransferase TuaG